MDILYTYDICEHTHTHIPPPHYELGSRSYNWLQSARRMQAHEASYWIKSS